MNPWCLYWPECGGQMECGCEECPCLGMEYPGGNQLVLDLDADDEPTTESAA